MYFIIIILQFHNYKHRKMFKTFPATGVLTLSPPFRLYYSSLSQVFSDLVYLIPWQRFSVRATTVPAEYSSSAVADRSTLRVVGERRPRTVVQRRLQGSERQRERERERQSTSHKPVGAGHGHKQNGGHKLAPLTSFSRQHSVTLPRLYSSRLYWTVCRVLKSSQQSQ